MLFADNNTLWIGSQYCATGERAKLGLNYNCLTRVVPRRITLKPQIIPNVTSTAAHRFHIPTRTTTSTTTAT